MIQPSYEKFLFTVDYNYTDSHTRQSARNKICRVFISTCNIYITPIAQGSGIIMEEGTERFSEPELIAIYRNIVIARHINIVTYTNS